MTNQPPFNEALNEYRWVAKNVIRYLQNSTIFNVAEIAIIGDVAKAHRFSEVVPCSIDFIVQGAEPRLIINEMVKIESPDGVFKTHKDELREDGTYYCMLYVDVAGREEGFKIRFLKDWKSYDKGYTPTALKVISEIDLSKNKLLPYASLEDLKAISPPSTRT